MIRTPAIWVGLSVICLISAGTARAQNNFDSLDLTDDAKKEEKKDEPPPKKRAPVVEDAPKAKDDGPAVERDTTQDDRVKSVQKKLYSKRGRFELAPSVVISVNDPYYSKFGGAIRAAFYPADSLALSARFTLMQVLPTDDVRSAKRNFNSRIFFSVPIWSAMADVEWSPLYGKVSIFNSILHLDGYLIGGAGVVYTETSALKDRTVNIAADLGIGFRFVVKDFLAINVALINTTYVDQPAGTTKGATQNVMVLSAGASIFFPLKSTFRESE